MSKIKCKCKCCSCLISGKINIDTHRRKLGKKWINDVYYYCSKCFKKLNMEKSWNAHRKKISIIKKHNKTK